MKKDKSSSTPTPAVELTNMGPSFDLVTRRTQFASPDNFKQACKKPVTAKPKKRKNVSMDVFGNKEGTVHMKPQDLSVLKTGAQTKSLRKALHKDKEEQEPKAKKQKVSQD